MQSLSPHRVLGVDENDELLDTQAKNEHRDFAQMILENLRTAGVQQAHKEDEIVFCRDLVCAEGRYTEGANGSAVTRRAAIFIGPEFGTVTRTDLVAAAREAADAKFDILIACAFSFDGHCSEFKKLKIGIHACFENGQAPPVSHVIFDNRSLAVAALNQRRTASYR